MRLTDGVYRQTRPGLRVWCAVDCTMWSIGTGLCFPSNSSCDHVIGPARQILCEELIVAIVFPCTVLQQRMCTFKLELASLWQFSPQMFVGVWLEKPIMVRNVPSLESPQFRLVPSRYTCHDSAPTLSSAFTHRQNGGTVEAAHTGALTRNAALSKRPTELQRPASCYGLCRCGQLTASSNRNKKHTNKIFDASLSFFSFVKMMIV